MLSDTQFSILINNCDEFTYTHGSTIICLYFNRSYAMNHSGFSY